MATSAVELASAIATASVEAASNPDVASSRAASVGAVELAHPIATAAKSATLTRRTNRTIEPDLRITNDRAQSTHTEGTSMLPRHTAKRGPGIVC